MAAVLAATVMFAAVAAALGLLLYLPSLAVVESLSPRRAGARAAIWLLALVLPVAGGISAATAGLRSAYLDRYGSPHLEAPRPHLCSRWLLAAPDARLHVTLVGLLCGGMSAGALVRLFVSGGRSWLMERRMWGAVRAQGPATEAPADVPQLRIDSDLPLLATVGLWRPLVVFTSEVEAELTERELAAALRHEAAHARRRDNLLDLVATAALTSQLYVPTAHLYARYWREEAERACDDSAAAGGAAEVASALVKLALVGERRAGGRLEPWAAQQWRHVAADVERRAARLAAGGEPPRWTGPPGVAGAVAATVAVGIPVLAAVATAHQVTDTLRCMADTLLAVLGAR